MRRPSALNAGRVLAALPVITTLLAMTVLPALAGFQAFQTFNTVVAASGVMVVDVNGDGKPDITTNNVGNSSISVLLNTTPVGATSASFGTVSSFGTNNTSSSASLADVNGDGKPDIISATSDADAVQVMLNTTPPGATTASFGGLIPFSVDNTFGVTAADLNGDGKIDIASANISNATVSVLLNTTPDGDTTPTFANEVPFGVGTNPRATTAADVNGDGKPDLLVSNGGSATISVLLNTTPNGATTPSFASQVVYSVGTTPRQVAATDVNGDGRLDLAVANGGSNSVSILLNTTANGAATPSFTPQVAFNAGGAPFSVAAADLNGDGKPDLATANNTGNTVSVLLNMTGAASLTPVFAAEDAIATAGPHRGIAAADLNGDGKPDLAVSSGISSVGVLLAAPSGTLQFSNGSVTVSEGAGTANVTLSRTGSTDGQISGIVSVTGGTATLGQDFTLAGPQTVTWADGDGANKTVSIPVTQDQLDEGDESVQFTLTLPSNRFGAVLGAQTTASLTITDDDPLVLSIANVSQPEGNVGTSTATFTVSKIGSTVRSVTVHYATADGSATAGSDYTATSGTLTFAPNETTKTIAVPILGDTLAEPDEAFTVTLSNPTNATLGVAQATGIITNEDVAVACTPRPRVKQTVVSGGGALQVQIESTPLNAPANNPLRQIKLGTFQNAAVTLNGQPVTSGQTVSLPPNTVGVDMVVRRATAGQATMVPFTVVDGCGEWQTFVGGGTAAGF